MTKVRFIGPIGGFSGAMGDMVFADRKKKNRTTAYLKQERDPSQAQTQVQDKFAKASRRAKKALQNPVLLALYETVARERGDSAYQVAFSDRLVVPYFSRIDLSDYHGRIGDEITIHAVDDVGLARVDVKLVAQDGSPIEQGAAVEDGERSGAWIYTATKAVTVGSDIFVELKGADHAGNKAKYSENPTVEAEEED